MKTQYLFITTIVLVVSLLALQVSAKEQQATELRIGYQKYGNLLLVKTKGNLEKELAKQGITVKWIEFPGGPQLLEGLNVGSIDFGVTGETPPIFAQAAGANLVYVANEPAASTSEAIVVAQDSPIQSVVELKGKRVALNKGSNVHYLLVRALQQAGLKYADIKPIYLNPSDARAAFESNSVDAWVIWDPFQAAAEIQLSVRVLKDGSELVNNHQFYLASRPYAEQNPQVITAIIEEIQKVGAWPKNNPEEVAELVAPILGLSKEITLLAVTRQSYGTSFITPEVVAEQQKIADTFFQLRLIPKKLTVSEVIWTPPIAQQAKQAN